MKGRGHPVIRTTETKECRSCKQLRPYAEFYAHPRTKDGRCTECRTCHVARVKVWRATKGRGRLPGYGRKASLKRLYSLSVEEVEKMSVAQNHKCAICGATAKAKRLQVDHNHSTGKIRQLLCHLCNRGLGLFRDNPVLLERATKYLVSHAT